MSTTYSLGTVDQIPFERHHLRFPVMPTSYHFLNLTNPNDLRNGANKRRIRQHAMRDIGRCRRKDNPKDPSVLITFDGDQATKPDDEAEQAIVPKLLPSVTGSVVDPFLQTPFALDESDKRLVSFGMSRCDEMLVP
jgi:hypothetical protein